MPSVSPWLISLYGLSNASRLRFGSGEEWPARRIDAEVDARLEIAEIQRRVCAAGGPALLFTRVKGCRFPMVSNLFGTIDRARFMFRDTLERVRRLVELKIDPTAGFRRPLRYAGVPLSALATVPRFVSRGDVTANETTISQLPQQVSWPDDGGAFITLPQVYTEDVAARLAAFEPGHVSHSAFRRAVRAATAKSACTIKFSARSASITRRRSARASRFA